MVLASASGSQRAVAGSEPTSPSGLNAAIPPAWQRMVKSRDGLPDGDDVAMNAVLLDGPAAPSVSSVPAPGRDGASVSKSAGASMAALPPTGSVGWKQWACYTAGIAAAPPPPPFSFPSLCVCAVVDWGSQRTKLQTRNRLDKSLIPV
jgi:hypothetical protein